MPGVEWGMESYKRGSHTVWDCKYHLVWVTKYATRSLVDVGQRCRELLRETARRTRWSSMPGPSIGTTCTTRTR